MPMKDYIKPIMHEAEVAVLLSVYNGGSYLEEQLDSIISQTYTHWKLWVRDDGSKDNTRFLIQEYMNRFPGKIIFLTAHGNLGASKSFGLLLDVAKAPYMMFCDQDDVWLPEKIERTLSAMKAAEKETPDFPILVHTDLQVVDQTMKVISNSMWAYQKLNPNAVKLHEYLIQNHATGCTMMLNTSLKDLVIPIPTEAIMHDWWIALTASTFGKVKVVFEPTIKYRQHGNNEVGAKAYKLNYFAARFFKLRDSIASNKRIIAQAQAFLGRYEECLSNEQRVVIKKFSLLLSTNSIIRAWTIARYQLYKYGLMRNIAYIGVMIVTPRVKNK
jgi:glycosyltransferase involved in cell wall biosynthesis